MSTDSTLEEYFSLYKYPDEAMMDLAPVLQQYDKLGLSAEPFEFSDRSTQLLVHLEGVVPVPFKGNTYNIPVRLWLMQSFPNSPPVVYVRPTSEMYLASVGYVDSAGKVDLPYLREWRRPACDLLGLVQMLIVTFSEDCPVFALTSPTNSSLCSADIRCALETPLTQCQYQNVDATVKDLVPVRQCYRDLQPAEESFEFSDGSRRQLVYLGGTIPVPIKGSTYNIPIQLWVMDSHPHTPPVVRVCPTSSMQISPGRFVDGNGTVSVAYLSKWRSPSSNLKKLVEMLISIFSQECPVYSKRPAQATGSSDPDVTGPRAENTGGQGRPKCTICLDEDLEMMFLPCKHFVSCKSCSAALKTCPICRSKIERREKIFMA